MRTWPRSKRIGKALPLVKGVILHFAAATELINRLAAGRACAAHCCVEPRDAPPRQGDLRPLPPGNPEEPRCDRPPEPTGWQFSPRTAPIPPTSERGWVPIASPSVWAAP